jgi:putative pyruvate formate lyase activating enzyme
MQPQPEPAFEAAYVALHRRGELAARASAALALLHACRLCGWDCGIDREAGVGPCRTGMQAVVASAYLHLGEERPLVAGGGSGAIFFASCDLRCQFCQTYRWNIHGSGRLLEPRQIADVMLDLQGRGAVNINLVTPTHIAPQVLAALALAAEDGLSLPLVWNSGGYDAPQVLALLDGVVDIYLPDMKYSDERLARRLSGVRDYPRVNQQAVREMLRQVGHLRVSAGGTAQRGLIIRHLVMPGCFDNTAGVLRWIADETGPDTYLSLMDQYRPAYRAFGRDGLGRAMTAEEYAQARDYALGLGLRRLDDSLTLEPSP